MDDLISRERVIATIDSFNVFESRYDQIKLELMIRELPSAEPKRGRWIKLDMHRGMADHKCTACEQECYVPTCMGEPMYAYCPNCGAKMEVNNESN